MLKMRDDPDELLKTREIEPNLALQCLPKHAFPRVSRLLSIPWGGAYIVLQCMRRSGLHGRMAFGLFPRSADINGNVATRNSSRFHRPLTAWHVQSGRAASRRPPASSEPVEYCRGV